MTENMEKKTESICAKVTERMALDLLRLAAVEDLSISEFVCKWLERELYGRMMRVDQVTEKLQRLHGTDADK